MLWNILSVGNDEWCHRRELNARYIIISVTENAVRVCMRQYIVNGNDDGKGTAMATTTTTTTTTIRIQCKLLRLKQSKYWQKWNENTSRKLKNFEGLEKRNWWRKCRVMMSHLVNVNWENTTYTHIHILIFWGGCCSQCCYCNHYLYTYIGVTQSFFLFHFRLSTPPFPSVCLFPFAYQQNINVLNFSSW